MKISKWSPYTKDGPFCHLHLLTILRRNYWNLPEILKMLSVLKISTPFDPKLIYAKVTLTLPWKSLQSSGWCVFTMVCCSLRAGQQPLIIDSQHLQQSPGVLQETTSDPITSRVLWLICVKAIIALFYTLWTCVCSAGIAPVFCYSCTWKLVLGSLSGHRPWPKSLHQHIRWHRTKDYIWATFLVAWTFLESSNTT